MRERGMSERGREVGDEGWGGGVGLQGGDDFGVGLGIEGGIVDFATVGADGEGELFTIAVKLCLHARFITSGI